MWQYLKSFVIACYNSATTVLRTSSIRSPSSIRSQPSFIPLMWSYITHHHEGQEVSSTSELDNSNILAQPKKWGELPSGCDIQILGVFRETNYGRLETCSQNDFVSAPLNKGVASSEAKKDVCQAKSHWGVWHQKWLSALQVSLRMVFENRRLYKVARMITPRATLTKSSSQQQLNNWKLAEVCECE